MKITPRRSLAFIIALIISATSVAHGAEPDQVYLALKNGSSVRGRVLSLDEHKVKIRTEAGDLVIAKTDLKEESLNRLLRSGESRETLVERISQLEAQVARLEKENQALRSAKNPAPAAKPETEPATDSQGTAASKAEAPPAPGGKWLSATGKRHNSKCRYFGSKSGRSCAEDEGVPCKSCGG